MWIILYFPFCASSTVGTITITTLETGYYYIEKIDILAKGSNPEKVEELYKKLDSELYFYYDSTTTMLTIYSIENPSKKGKVVFNEKKKQYTINIIRTVGILKLVENTKEKVVPIDTRHFSITLTEDGSWNSATVTFMCIQCSKHHPNIVAAQDRIEKAGSAIAKNFVPIHEELKEYDFSAQEVLPRTFSFGSIVLSCL